MKVVKSSLKAISDIVADKNCACFFWGDKEFTEEDLDIALNAPEDSDIDTQFIIVDLITAKAIKRVHDQLNDENKAKIERMLANSESSFARVAEFAWQRVA